VKSSIKQGRLARRSAALAAAALLLSAGTALAQVHLSAGSYYSGKSPACHRSGAPGTRCFFTFRASHGGFVLRLVGPTVVSTWECRRGGGEALLGGKASGNVPVPLLSLQADGQLSGRTGAGRQKIAVTGHIAEAGTKVVLRFQLVHQHCVTPKIVLFEGLAAAHGRH
jgi:hypothetical protein